MTLESRHGIIQQLSGADLLLQRNNVSAAAMWNMLRTKENFHVNNIAFMVTRVCIASFHIYFHKERFVLVGVYFFKVNFEKYINSREKRSN